MQKVSLEQLSPIIKRARGLGINKLYIHWTAGRYDQVFEDYHINITGDGDIYAQEFSLFLNHTYKRNSNAIGIAVDAMYNGTPEDFGDYPVTKKQMNVLAQVIAKICIELPIPLDIEHVLTHAEAADNKDGCYPDYEYNGYPNGMYGPDHNWERWDLWKTKPEDAPYSGGDIIRGNARWYSHEWGCPI